MFTLVETVEVSQAVSLTDRIFALDEPWRSRFLQFVASCAQIRPVDQTWPMEVTPSWAEVVSWLADERLNVQIRLMLYTWTHWYP